MAPLFNVAVLIYPGADIIDFFGPIEIFSTSPQPGKDQFFKIATFASGKKPISHTGGAMTLVPALSVEDVNASLEDYDIVVVPGAMPDTITDLLATTEGKAINDLLARFATLAPRQETGHRIALSVCTGALFFAAAGMLANRTATTHHMAYDYLKTFADKAAGGESNVNVVRKRWVDSGANEAGVRIVNAGGVTSGFDAALYIVEFLVGKESADWAAEVAEFERRKQEDGWAA